MAKLLKQLKTPLRDAAMMNATRWALKKALEDTGLPVSCFSGGHTKWNRSKLDVPKTHALDAACCGPTDGIARWEVPTIVIKATGRGSYKRTRLDKYGFPRGYLMQQKSVHGFATGDHVRAEVPNGLKTGTHVGRVAVRKSGSFNVQTAAGVIQGINWKHCRLLQRGDGYAYSSLNTSRQKESIPPHS